jgi:hypothetical protein
MPSGLAAVFERWESRSVPCYNQLLEAVSEAQSRAEPTEVHIEQAASNTTIQVLRVVVTQVDFKRPAFVELISGRGLKVKAPEN